MKTRRTSPSRKPAEQGSVAWAKLWRGASLILLGAVLATATHYVTGPLRQGNHRSDKSQSQPGAKSATNRWGQLEVTSIWLERPLDYFAYDPPAPSSTTWYFGKMTTEQVVNYLRQGDLPPALLNLLLETNRWTTAPEGTILEVPIEVVRDLPAEARARLYALLEETPQNAAQCYPYANRVSFSEWFAQSGLHESTLNLIEGMMYRRDGLWCFADRHVLSKLLPPEEYMRASRALARVPTLLVQLRVGPDSDIEQLMNYWGLPARKMQARPLLESLKRLPEGGSLNIAWFFPPVPRLLLYSYPHPTNTINGRWPDCFWSSYNFLYEKADDRFMDARHQEQVLRSEYRIVPRAEMFGDLILLYEPRGEDIATVHMCVYVAEDIVFTKNGYAPREPWVLMRLADMMIHYSPKKPLSRMVFRHRSRMPQ